MLCAQKIRAFITLSVSYEKKNCFNKNFTLMEFLSNLLINGSESDGCPILDYAGAL